MTSLSVSSSYYWDETVESRSIALNQAKDYKTKEHLYMEIREPIQYMIGSILNKRKLWKDKEAHLVDLETECWKVLNNPNFDPTKSKMYSYLTRSVWNYISKLYKKQIHPKNNNISFHQDEDNPMDFADENLQEEYHHHIINVLESEIFWIIPFNFPNREKDFFIICDCAYAAIDIFRENEIRRVKAFKEEILQRVPSANKNMVNKLIPILRKEYQRIKKRV